MLKMFNAKMVTAGFVLFCFAFRFTLKLRFDTLVHHFQIVTAVSIT